MAQVDFRKKTWEIPESSSPCEAWTIYFDQLDKEFGRQNARQIWLLTWEQNGATSCTTNAKFNRWLKRKDIDVSNAATRVMASGSEMVTNVFGLGANITSLLKIGIPVVLVMALAYIGYSMYQSAKTGQLPGALKMTPVGQAISIAKR